jgi:hypothetical protein
MIVGALAGGKGLDMILAGGHPGRRFRQRAISLLCRPIWPPLFSQAHIEVFHGLVRVYRIRAWSDIAPSRTVRLRRDMKDSAVSPLCLLFFPALSSVKKKGPFGEGVKEEPPRHA